MQYTAPFVQEDAEGKSLHFTLGELQSRMIRAAPWQLALDYTRSMMGFLLWEPSPARIGMIGLGGGSLAKFCYRHLPASDLLVLEINPHVIALREDFAVPPDDARFRVLAADAAAYLHTQAPSFDVLLVDGFDAQGQPPALCSPAFYADCLAALGPQGLLVVNLHYDHPDYPLQTERLRLAFGGNVVEVLASEKSNGIVFASAGPSLRPRSINVRRTLARLDAEARLQLRADFERIAWQLSAQADDPADDGPV